MTIMTVENRFQSCVSSILEHEGGLTEDVRDPGGITNWGISLRFMLQDDSEDHPTAETIRNLTKPDAIAIYRRYWWNRYRYAAFEQLIVIEKVFDMAVNMGAMEAHKLLQVAINCLMSKPIPVDGLLGVMTFGAANSLDGEKLREQLRKGAKDRYLDIIRANPHMEWAEKGWMIRASW